MPPGGPLAQAHLDGNPMGWDGDSRRFGTHSDSVSDSDSDSESLGDCFALVVSWIDIDCCGRDCHSLIFTFVFILVFAAIHLNTWLIELAITKKNR